MNNLTSYEQGMHDKFILKLIFLYSFFKNYNFCLFDGLDEN